ncbi:type IV toxin-antitoxin system AbiEi family antitoxin domain-containing protein [candidate division WOR-3 bacterium]|nr:type IV toxin-antitoxin system AbiEi family antitoxin domain-containing protein [candidate division WOR-3 bacterium]
MNKITNLYRMLYDEIPYFSSYLKSLGYDYGLLHKYKTRGWLDSPYKSVYVKPGGHISPLGIVYALQTQKNMNIHIGGISALILKGISEQVYNINELRNLHILSTKRIFVPQWVKKFAKEHNLKLNFMQNNIFKSEIGLTYFHYNKMEIMISSTERAVMEMLSMIRTRSDYFDALKYFELTGELRGEKLLGLLKNCNSVKCKRLFLYLSEKYEKDYIKKIDRNVIDLGRGTRRIINDKGKSVYIRDYDIEIPRETIF